MDERWKIYRELSQGSVNYTRLLKVYPALDPGSNIECELLVVALTSSGAFSTSELKYTALSYAWKEDNSKVQDPDAVFVRPSFVHFLTDEWVKVEVPHSLFLALRRLRQSEGEELLWIDSICINQKDDKERTKQVAMMSKIYSLAERVIIWLGEREVDDELGEWLQGLSQRKVVFTDWSDTEQCEALVNRYLAGYRELGTSFAGSLQRKADVFGAFCLIWLISQGTRPEDIEFYHSFLSGPKQSTLFESKTQRFTYEWMAQVSQGLRVVMNRNWVMFTLWSMRSAFKLRIIKWRRAWVVQETVLARNAAVIYGAISAPWTMFAKAALNFLQQRSMQDPDKMEIYRHFHGYETILEQKTR